MTFVNTNIYNNGIKIFTTDLAIYFDLFYIAFNSYVL